MGHAAIICRDDCQTAKLSSCDEDFFCVGDNGMCLDALSKAGPRTIPVLARQLEAGSPNVFQLFFAHKMEAPLLSMQARASLFPVAVTLS